MKNGDKPAMPVECDFSGPEMRGRQIDTYSGWSTGLTKRELFAAMAMQGSLANSEVDMATSLLASHCVHMADALLAELAKGGAS